MGYVLKPSLEHIALVKIAVTLWNQDDIKALMSKFCFPFLVRDRIEEWQKIEDRVIEKVPQLPQLGFLKEKIKGCIKPIGLQILKWMEYHCTGCYLHVDLPAKFYWTPQGTVDRKKTAELLIKDENLSISTRYKLACIYCLEDVRNLWNRMPENSRKFFHSERHSDTASQQDIVFYWTCYINGEMTKFDNMIERKFLFRGSHRKCSYQYALEYIVDRNKSAIEYFLKKLHPSELEKTLVDTTKYVVSRHVLSYYDSADIPNVVCFLLSQMDMAQQKDVFETFPCAVLKCFLNWPWQNFFMKTANRMQKYLDKEHYVFLLQRIIDKVKDGYKDYNYQKLFGEFWQQIPIAYQRYVVTRFLLLDLFNIKDKKNIKLIFHSATRIEKRKIFYYCGQDICQNLIYDDEWDLLEFFIQECILSEDEMIMFKEKFKKQGCFINNEFNYERREKFFRLLDDFFSWVEKTM